MKAGFQIILPALIIFLFSTASVLAKSGCCSHHNGVSGCDTSTGRQVCNDGTYSPSCMCAYVAPMVATQAPIIYIPTIKPTARPVETFAPTPVPKVEPLIGGETTSSSYLWFAPLGIIGWLVWKKLRKKL